MIDTHAHLDACSEPAADLLGRARAVGVERVVAVGSGIESCRQALAIARSEPGVACALGIHPHQAGGPDAERLDDLEELLRDDHARAVGETGLDFFRDYAPHADQRRLFERQLELASSLSLPVVVHTATPTRTRRRARRLRTGPSSCTASRPRTPGRRARARLLPLLRRQCHVPEGDRAPRRGRSRSRDRILAETDCPYLAPQPVRGRPNEPAYVVHTVAALAALRGETVETLAAQIDENATRAFGLP